MKFVGFFYEIVYHVPSAEKKRDPAKRLRYFCTKGSRMKKKARVAILHFFAYGTHAIFCIMLNERTV